MRFSDVYAEIGVGFLILFAALWYGVTHLNRGATIRTMHATSSSFVLTSSVFTDGASIPMVYTCDGTRTLHPPLSIRGIPEGAQSLALIVHDPDVPKVLKPDGIFDHWVAFNIPATTTEIAEGEVIGVMGANGAGKSAYTGPCPPREYEPSEHRYIFTLYALDTSLPLPEGATKAQVLAAMGGHVLAETKLVGRYRRP